MLAADSGEESTFDHRLMVWPLIVELSTFALNCSRVVCWIRSILAKFVSNRYLNRPMSLFNLAWYSGWCENRRPSGPQLLTIFFALARSAGVPWNLYPLVLVCCKFRVRFDVSSGSNTR